MKSYIFGHTVTGCPIPAYQFGSQGPRVLILGGVHGDEKEGVIAAHGLLDKFIEGFSYNLQLTLVPMFNFDGVVNGQRKNAIGVDLNRNLPTKDWTNDVEEPRYYPGPEPTSEPENKALVEFLKNEKPSYIFSLHSWKPLLNTNGRCEPESEIISKRTGYELKDSIGYPTPGCLGTYTGLERDIPTLTYEIEKGLDAESILRVHVPAILEALKSTQDRRS